MIARNIKPITRKKVQKEIEIINFLDPNSVDLKGLFAHGSSSINLKNDKLKSKNLLPEDLHISSKDFVKLFSNQEYMVFS